MAKIVVALSSSVLEREWREGDIDTPSLDASFFAFFLQKEQLSHMHDPAFMTFVERAENGGRTHWRDPVYEVEDHNWIKGVIRMLEANGVEVEDHADPDFEWTCGLLEQALAKVGVELLW